MAAPSDPENTGPLWKRLAWMAAIWTMSTAALGIVAFALRAWLL